MAQTVETVADGLREFDHKVWKPVLKSFLLNSRDHVFAEDFIEDEHELCLSHRSKCLTQDWRDVYRSFSSQCVNTSIEFPESKEVILLHIADRGVWHFPGHMQIL